MRKVLLVSIAALGLAACTNDSDTLGVTYVDNHITDVNAASR